MLTTACNLRRKIWRDLWFDRVMFAAQGNAPELRNGPPLQPSQTGPAWNNVPPTQLMSELSLHGPATPETVQPNMQHPYMYLPPRMANSLQHHRQLQNQLSHLAIPNWNQMPHSPMRGGLPGSPGRAGALLPTPYSLPMSPPGYYVPAHHSPTGVNSGNIQNSQNAMRAQGPYGIQGQYSYSMAPLPHGVPMSPPRYYHSPAQHSPERISSAGTQNSPTHNNMEAHDTHLIQGKGTQGGLQRTPTSPLSPGGQYSPNSASIDHKSPTQDIAEVHYAHYTLGQSAWLATAEDQCPSEQHSPDHHDLANKQDSNGTHKDLQANRSHDSKGEISTDSVGDSNELRIPLCESQHTTTTTHTAENDNSTETDRPQTRSSTQAHNTNRGQRTGPNHGQNGPVIPVVGWRTPVSPEINISAGIQNSSASNAKETHDRNTMQGQGDGLLPTPKGILPGPYLYYHSMMPYSNSQQRKMIRRYHQTQARQRASEETQQHATEETQQSAKEDTQQTAKEGKQKSNPEGTQKKKSSSIKISPAANATKARDSKTKKGQGDGLLPTPNGLPQGTQKKKGTGKRGKARKREPVSSDEDEEYEGYRPRDLGPQTLSLSEQIDKVYLERKEPVESIQIKEAQVKKLEGVVYECYDEAALVLAGSTVTGFSTNSSDSDLCLCFTGCYTLSRKEGINVLKDLKQDFSPFLGRRAIEVVAGAKVPVMIIYHLGSTIDITVNNINGLRNPYLLMCYSALDPRVARLVVVVKCWAKQAGITDPKQHRLSGFALALMVIHYLQAHCNPPVLPSLHQTHPEWFYDPDMETCIRRLRDRSPPDFIKEMSSSNTQSLEDLLLGFFKFYSSYHFDKIISVRTPKSDIPETSEFSNGFIRVEDPSDLRNVARAVNDYNIFKEIRRTLKRASQALHISRDLRSVLDIPKN